MKIYQAEDVKIDPPSPSRHDVSRDMYELVNLYTKQLDTVDTQKCTYISNRYRRKSYPEAESRSWPQSAAQRNLLWELITGPDGRWNT